MSFGLDHRLTLFHDPDLRTRIYSYIIHLLSSLLCISAFTDRANFTFLSRTTNFATPSFLHDL